MMRLSLGVAVLPEHGIGPSDLIAAADQALYRAKTTGRNRTAVARGFVTVEARVLTE